MTIQTALNTYRQGVYERWLYPEDFDEESPKFVKQMESIDALEE